MNMIEMMIFKAVAFAGIAAVIHYAMKWNTKCKGKK